MYKIYNMMTALYILLLFGGFDLFLVSNVALFIIRNNNTQLINKNEYNFYKTLLYFSTFCVLIALPYFN